MNARLEYKREWRRKRREDPAYLVKERDAARARRLNPEVKERERIYAREYMRDVRSTEEGRTRIRERNRTRTRLIKGIPAAPYPAPTSCECCGYVPDNRWLVIDHDHITGMFRGWLCDACNGGLGMLGDTVEALDKARLYLMRQVVA